MVIVNIATPFVYITGLFTLYASLHKDSRVGQGEDVAHVKDFAHVSMEEFQARREGHPQELHLLALLFRQALVTQMCCQMMTVGCSQLLCLVPSLSQLIPQL